MAARATVEALLRDKKLDRTLTTSMPERLGENAVAPLEIASLDRALAGGVPRGQVSEVFGPASSGRTSVVWAAMGAATRRGEYVALIDTFDRFDPPTGAACGIELSRLLWARGQAISKTAGALDPSWLPGVRPVGGAGTGIGTIVERAIDRALKSLNLVVQSGVCTMVVIDLVDVPAHALRRLPATTWFRIERLVENTEIAVVLLASRPIARSKGGRSIKLETGSRQESASRRISTQPPGESLSCLPACVISRHDSVRWRGEHDRARRFAGARSEIEVAAARTFQTERVVLETVAANAV